MRKLASERGEIQEFSAADQDTLRDCPQGATERFAKTGDAGIPVKPVGQDECRDTQREPLSKSEEPDPPSV